MYIVIYQALDELNCERHFYGPYANYEQAYYVLSTLPVGPARARYIQELEAEVPPAATA